MRKEDKTSISTPIPASVPRESLINALHDHETLIKLDKSVEGYQLTNGNAEMSAEYAVTAKKPIGKTIYEYQITNHNDGCDTDTSAHPPPGLLKIWSKFRVVQGKEGWSLQEDVRLEGSRLIVGKVKSNVSEEHKQWHQKLLEVAKNKATAS